MSDYGKQVINHYKIQNDVALELLSIAERLCPGTWVLQVLTNIEVKDGRAKKVFCVTVTNGDDNATAMNENLGAALAQLIYYLLDGFVFPLTGEGGHYYYPGDRGWIRKPVEDQDKGEDE